MAALGRPSSTSSSNTPPSPSWSCLSSSLNRAFLSFRWYLGLKAYFPSRTSILGLLANAWREGERFRFPFFVCVSCSWKGKLCVSTWLPGTYDFDWSNQRHSVVKANCNMWIILTHGPGTMALALVNQIRNVSTTQAIQVPSTCKAYFYKFCNQRKSSCYNRQHALPYHSKKTQDVFFLSIKQTKTKE